MQFAIALLIASCLAPVYHQFDFWVGNWRVTDARGKLLGYDYLSKRSGRRQWHQSFVDDSGFVLDLDGSLQNDAMVLEGTDYVDGRARLNRGIWRKRGDAVEELWQISMDGGRTWKQHFDGWFHRMP